MKSTFKIILLIITMSWVAGCNSYVQNYVAGTKPGNFSGPTSETISSPMSLKVTPGKMNAAGGGMVVQGTISITNQSFSLGSDRALSLTISRNRVLPQ